MAMIQFTGIRNLGNLFGILSQRSVPTELNIEDGISVVYDANEAIRETEGKTYLFFAQTTLAPAAVLGSTTMLPFQSAPAIPLAHIDNCYMVSISASLTGVIADWTGSILSMIIGPMTDVLAQDTVAGQVEVATFASRGSGASGTSALIQTTVGGVGGRSGVLLPYKMPRLVAIGTLDGGSLVLETTKAVGAGNVVVNTYIQFWAGPPGVTCPWL